MSIKKLLKTIVLPVLLLITAAAWGQQDTKVTGKVTDSKDGAGLSGVSVLVKGTKIGTSTDASGSYTIQAPANGTLVFSSVGFTPREVAVAAGNFNVSLVGSTVSSLNEVVVIGYGTARKKDLTGAVATVTAKDFQKGNITTPEQMIAGKVAGVSVISNGGRPGAGSTIRVRGGSSLNASNDPLIVIDGVPLGSGGVDGSANPLSFINPNDIESFTILKDASAAAIYGSRANNGVIIITTKKGKGGKLRVNFSSVNSLSEVTKTIPVLTGDQVRQLVATYGSPLQKSQVGTANTDWQDEIYQTGFGTDNNLSLSGGLKNFPYRLTLGYLNQSGIVMTDQLKKTSVSLAINPTLFNNHLKVDLNLKGSAQDTRFADDGAMGTASGFDPTQPVYSTLDKRFGGFWEWREADGSLVLNRANNPVGWLQQARDEKTPKRLIGNLQLDYKFHFLPELRANVNLALDASKSEGAKFHPDSAAVSYLNGGLYEEEKSERKNSVLDFYLNYTKDLKSIKSRVDFTAGYSYNNFYLKKYYPRSLNAKRDTVAGSSAPSFPFDEPENTLISYWGRLLYNYDSRFFLTASMRRDGSSRFAEEHRWGWFPSVGVAWSLKAEDFLRNNKTISDLKIRFGYGLTGQQDFYSGGTDYHYYDYLGRYALGNNSSQYQFGNTYYTTYGPLGYNSTLKWEELSSYNVALDFGFLEGRITGSIDFYKRKSKDLIVKAPQPTGTNFTSFINANVGDMENKGVEFTINTQAVKQKDFSWDIGLNLTYNKNEITRLTTTGASEGLPVEGADAVNGFVQLQQVGYSRNTFYLYQQVYGKDGLPIEGLFEDRNRDGLITPADRYLSKTAAPNFLGGFSTTAYYKQWSLGTVLRATFNNYVYNNIYSNRGRLNQVLGAYIIGNASSNYLDTRFEGNVDVQPLSDMYIENASFLKMDNLFLGFNAGKILKGVANLRLTGSVQNVFVATKYKGLDPEHGNGVDRNLYPRPRIYAISINLDF